MGANSELPIYKLGRQMLPPAVMKSLSKWASGFMLLQPFAAYLFYTMPHGHAAAFGFLPIAILGSITGVGILTWRPWAYKLFRIYAPAHLAFLAIGFSRRIEGVVILIVLAVLFYGIYISLPRKPQAA